MLDTTKRGSHHQRVDTTALADRLTHLGLTSYEAKAYVALVRRDSYTAAQVARQAGLPRQRIYDVLGSLVAEGPRDVTAGLGREVRGGRPGARRRAPRSRRTGARAGRPRAGRRAEAIAAWRRRSRRARPTPIRSSTSRCCATAARSTSASPSSRRASSARSSSSPSRPTRRRRRRTSRASRSPGPHVARSVYEFSVFDDPATTEGVRRFIDAGEEARFVEQLPLKLVIIDETMVMFGMQDPVAGTRRADDHGRRAPDARQRS